MIAGLNQWSADWWPYFGAAVIQNTIFLGIVFVVLRALRNVSAQARYLVAIVGLVKLLFPPLIPVAVFSTASEIPLARSFVTLVDGAGSATASRVAPSALPSAASVLFVVWLAVVLAYSGLSLIRTLRIRRALSDAVPLTTPTLPRHLQLMKSGNIAMPLTVGVFPRKVYVPACWENWPAKFRSAVLRHEVAHITRFDGLVQLGQILAGAVYFFHPLVWVLNRKLDMYREMACDDSSSGNERLSRLEYSRCLAEIAENTTRYPLAHESVSALMRRKNEILARVRYQTKEGIMRSVSKWQVTMIVTGLACCAVPLSWHPGNSSPRQSTAEAKKTAAGMSTVDVDITNGTSMRVRGSATTVNALEIDLHGLIDRDPGNVVIRLNCDEGVPMQTLFQVQEILIRNGLTKVSYENGVGAGLPLVLPSVPLREKMKSISATDISDVLIGASGTVTFDGESIRAGELPQRVAYRLQENPYLIVSIEAHPDATYADFIAVLREVKAGNAQRIFIKQPAP